MRFFLLVTFIFIMYRLGNFITVPFMINDGSVSDFLSTITKTGVLNQQALQRLSLFSLGIIPYITAGIVIQLLKFILSDTQYANNLNHKKFLSNQTLLLTLLISFVQSFMFAAYSSTSDISFLSLFCIVMFLVAGSFVMVWFAKVITSFGFGNGASILIMLSIIEHLFLSTSDIFYSFSIGELSFFSFFSHVLFIITLLFVISYVELSHRPLKLFYPSTKFRDGFNKSKKSDTLPLKVNNSGVLPLIFAMSFTALLSSTVAPFVYDSYGYDISLFLSIITIFFICFFVSFYTPFVMNTTELVNNLKKSNIIVENVRPGIATKKFIDAIIVKLNYIAVLYLSLMVLIPDILRYNGFDVVVSGVSAVILVVVIVDILRRIQYMNYSNLNAVSN